MNASSAVCGGVMPGMQQVHQLDVLNLLRVMSRLNRLRMTSGLRAHLHRHHLDDDGLLRLGKQTCMWRTQHVYR